MRDSVADRDKENTNIPVIDMVKTVKNIRIIMNLVCMKPILIARITGHSLQGIYDCLGGKKMPNLDNLMLLSRLLNHFTNINFIIYIKGIFIEELQAKVANVSTISPLFLLLVCIFIFICIVIYK